MVFFPRKFLTKDEGDSIIRCIKDAEKMTSGEIRVHFQKKIKGSVEDSAANAFLELKMDETEDRNGILFFIVPKKKVFAIIGDKGIDEVVPQGFWDEVRDLLEVNFKKKQWKKGLCKAIAKTGEKLKKYFPIKENDKNELPDEISYS